MAQTHLRLCTPQKPASGTDTTAYTSPAVTKTQLYHIAICNTGSTPCLVRVHIVQSAGSASTSNAFYYDVQIPGRDTFIANVATVMEAADFVVVRSDNGNAVFHLSGIQIT